MTQQQQTIGNTVYTVGQELKNYTEAGPLFDHCLKKANIFKFYEHSREDGEHWIGKFQNYHFPITITALPNPDVVADEWREVVHPDKRAGGYPEAMQEVCKAERVWHMWPDFTEWGGNKPLPTDDGMVVRDFGLIAETVDITIRCFLLGGKVSVKGGV